MHHEVTQHELEGGARLLTIQIPNTITYYWSSTFRAGYRFVPQDLYELPHLAEHLAFEGTKAYPDQLAFKIEIERDGTYFNASTSYDHVSFMYSGSRDELERIIPINMSQIYEPLYRDEQVAQEKEVIIQEMSRKKEDDSWRVDYLGLHAVTPERNPDIEERIARIPEISREELLCYHADCYGVANTDFVLAGDYSAKDIAGLKEKLNGQLAPQPVGRRQDYHKPVFGDFGGTVQTFEPYKQQQSQLLLRFVVPERDDEHFPALHILGVLLTGGLSARLQRKAREAGLTYGIRAAAGLSEDFTAFTINSQTNVERMRSLVELSLAELAAMGEGDFTDDELERAIGYSVGNVRRSNQTPAHYASWYAPRFVNGQTLESPEERVAQLEAVDRAALRAAYGRYITNETSILTLIGKGLEAHQSEYRELLASHLKKP